MKYLLIVLAIILIILQYKIWFGDGNVFNLYSLHKTNYTQQQINERQQTHNKKLSQEIYELKYSDTIIEKNARELLGMIKQDEEYYEFID